MNCKLPTTCTICNMYNGDQILPDRSVSEIETKDINNNFMWWIDIMCPLCFDSFLSEYNHIFYKIRRREITGKLK